MLGPFLHAIERPVDYHFAPSRMQWTVRLSDCPDCVGIRHSIDRCCSGLKR